MNKALVNLFIVGAAKCGTTFLAEYLGKHSKVQMPNVKEPNYFSHKELAELGLYYGTNDLNTLEDYHGLYSPSTEFLYYGEASVSYLPYPKVADNIYAYNPGAKIIILLRDPSERAYSHFKMDKRLGMVNAEFENIVLKKYYGALQNKYYHQYVELGFYAQRVQNYFDVFGKENVFVALNSNEMDLIIPEVLSFLNLEVEQIEQKRANEAIAFKSSLLSSLYKNTAVRRLLKKMAPPALVKRFTTEEEGLSGDLKDFLDELYKKDQDKVKRMISNG
jgi:hypothetical protein